MYADPANVRTNIIKLSLNEAEKAIIEEAAALSNEQPAQYAREAVLSGIVVTLVPESIEPGNPA